MQPSLQVRRLSEADAPAYYGLRLRSFEGHGHPVEPEVRDELDNGASGLADRLVRYQGSGTRVWGVFDQAILAGVAGATLDARRGERFAKLWGVFVLPRYRGTAVSRLLMDAVFASCEQEWHVRVISCTCASDDMHALQFLQRFGFEPLGLERVHATGAVRTMVRLNGSR